MCLKAEYLPAVAVADQAVASFAPPFITLDENGKSIRIPFLFVAQMSTTAEDLRQNFLLKFDVCEDGWS